MAFYLCILLNPALNKNFTNEKGAYLLNIFMIVLKEIVISSLHPAEPSCSTCKINPTFSNQSELFSMHSKDPFRVSKSSDVKKYFFSFLITDCIRTSLIVKGLNNLAYIQVGLQVMSSSKSSVLYTLGGRSFYPSILDDIARLNDDFFFKSLLIFLLISNVGVFCRINSPFSVQNTYFYEVVPSPLKFN